MVGASIFITFGLLLILCVWLEDKEEKEEAEFMKEQKLKSLTEDNLEETKLNEDLKEEKKCHCENCTCDKNNKHKNLND